MVDIGIAHLLILSSREAAYRRIDCGLGKPLRYEPSALLRVRPKDASAGGSF